MVTAEDMRLRQMSKQKEREGQRKSKEKEGKRRTLTQ
jgi:hypothetical protein